MEKDFEFYKKALKDKGLIQSFVAEKIGISGVSLNQRLQGYIKLKPYEKDIIDQLLGIADATKIRENISDFSKWLAVSYEILITDEMIEKYINHKFSLKNEQD